MARGPARRARSNVRIGIAAGRADADPRLGFMSRRAGSTGASLPALRRWCCLLAKQPKGASILLATTVSILGACSEGTRGLSPHDVGHEDVGPRDASGSDLGDAGSPREITPSEFCAVIPELLALRRSECLGGQASEWRRLLRGLQFEEECERFRQYVADGSMLFRATEADRCLSYLSSSACSDLDPRVFRIPGFNLTAPRNPSPANCDRLFVGVLTAGQSCAEGALCETGSVCDATTPCDPKCVEVDRPAGPDEVCHRPTRPCSLPYLCVEKTMGPPTCVRYYAQKDEDCYLGPDELKRLRVGPLLRRWHADVPGGSGGGEPLHAHEPGLLRTVRPPVHWSVRQLDL